MQNEFTSIRVNVHSRRGSSQHTLFTACQKSKLTKLANKQNLLQRFLLLPYWVPAWQCYACHVFTSAPALPEHVTRKKEKPQVVAGCKSSCDSAVWMPPKRLKIVLHRSHRMPQMVGLLKCPIRAALRKALRLHDEENRSDLASDFEDSKPSSAWVSCLRLLKVRSIEFDLKHLEAIWFGIWKRALGTLGPDTGPDCCSDICQFRDAHWSAVHAPWGDLRVSRHRGVIPRDRDRSHWHGMHWSHCHWRSNLHDKMQSSDFASLKAAAIYLNLSASGSGHAWSLYHSRWRYMKRPDACYRAPMVLFPVCREIHQKQMNMRYFEFPTSATKLLGRSSAFESLNYIAKQLMKQTCF